MMKNNSQHNLSNKPESQYWRGPWRLRPMPSVIAILVASALTSCATPQKNAPNSAPNSAPKDADVVSPVAATPASANASAADATRANADGANTNTNVNANANVSAQATTNAAAATAPIPAPTPPPAPQTAVNPTPAPVAAPVASPEPSPSQPVAIPPTTDRGSVVSNTDPARIYPGTGQFVKRTPPPLAPPKGGEETFNLNFEAQDIRVLIQYILGDYLKEPFSIHPGVTGNATIRTSQAVSRRDLVPILEMLLRDNGQVMIREEGMYKIRPVAVGLRGTTTPQVAGTSPLPNGFSVQMVQLKFVGAKDMARILEPYATDPTVSLKLDEARNLIILGGTQRELKHLLDIIDIFDIDFLAGYSVGLFPMQTDVKALSGDLDRLFGASGTGAGASVSPLAGIVRIIPIERMNGLLVISTQPRYLEEAKKWIERLDKAGGAAGGMRLNVYPVQHGKADKLAQLLSDVYGNGNRTGTTNPSIAPGQRPAQIGTANVPGQTPPGQFQTPLQALASAFQSSGIGVSQNTRIIADIDNNALLILSSPSDYETILSALRQLDVQRRQVKVEVLVAEVALKDELKYGIEWFINSNSSAKGSLRNSDAATSILPRALPDLRTGTVGSTSGLQLISLTPAGNIRAVLQALGDDGKSTLISTPNITVLDNEKASISVGTKISVTTGQSTTSTSGIVTSTSYIDTGVLLTVTPRINAGGRVTLEINQEVSSPLTVGGNPDISTRKAQTVVNVASGETLALAGLISKDVKFGTLGIPLLSKIPVIGGLFGSQSYTNNRTELVLLITPVVINNNDEARAVLNELRKKLPLLETIIPKEKPAK